MRHLNFFRVPFIAAAFLFAMSAWAGVPVTTGITTNPSQFFSGPGTQTITLTKTGDTGLGSQLSAAFALNGANKGDFAIVGGTCTAPGTELTSAAPTCTIIVNYTPHSASTETAELQITCSSVAIEGGFSLTCITNSTDSIGLVGAAALASVPAPLLDPKVLTLLSLMLLGCGMYFAARRNG